MGFHLIFLTPAFFVDVTEAWVYAGRWQRLVTIIAGIWVEMIFCAIGTIVWWGTAPGTFAHELAYKVMLITGVAVVLVNMNPLIKLDGYYFFSELLGIADLKEKSTAYVMGWIKKKIFRLPVEVDHVPGGDVFSTFLIASSRAHTATCCCSWLCISSFTCCRNSALIGLLCPHCGWDTKLFRSRIRTLVNFMKLVYLDKKERFQQWTTPRNIAIAGAALLLFLILPWRRVALEGRFILEPTDLAVVRRASPAQSTAMFVSEGQKSRRVSSSQIAESGLGVGSGGSKRERQDGECTCDKSAVDLCEFGASERERQQLMSERHYCKKRCGLWICARR